LATAAKDRTAFSTRAESDTSAAASGPARHHFDWGGATVAALWSAPLAPGTQLNANVWRAEFDGDATWFAAAPLHMSSARQTVGVHASLVRQHQRGEARAGFDFMHDHVAYRVRDDATTMDVVPGTLLGASEASTALFAEYLARVDAHWDVRPGVRTTLLASGAALFEPRLAIAFRATPGFSVTGGVARAYQTVQSLRNPESPAVTVFGVDLPVLSRGRIPIARSDEATLAVSALADERLRLTLDWYGRRLTDLSVVATGSAVPFAAQHPSVGDGYAWGFGSTVELRLERLTGRLAAGAGRTRIHLSDSTVPGATAFQPGFATTHSLTAAAAYRVGDATSIRSAVFARWGRRTTLFDGALDWEGCDALNGGCEIAGSPGRSLGAVSGARVPAYLRWDIGVRRAWTPRFAGRDLELDAYATVRNVLDRRNVWSWTAQGDEPARRLMLRPLSVLTAGLDFRY
ncbi:MAG: TonB-dependent receptor domain-containing protein, partial [Gemmatimonadaceae bacterium]